MRKKTLILLLASAICTCSFAQKKVTIKAGTIVPLESVKAVRATQVHEGEYVDFKVCRDVIVDGVVAIPTGTIAKGTVYEAKRSTAFGGENGACPPTRSGSIHPLVS